MSIEIVQFSEATYDVFQDLETARVLAGRSQRQKYRNVIDVVCSFDIETSYIEEIDESIMYIWQFAISDSTVIIGRTWDEFRKFISILETICLNLNARLVVFVHNLSYEFQFLRTILEFVPDDVFVVKKRRILTFTYHDLIEFRCSYFLSNMSLAEFTTKMEVEHRKLDGEQYDYFKKRYPWTEISKEELDYCVNDVIGLNEAVMKMLVINGDTLLTIPRTSTGYVRRDARAAMRRTPKGYVDSILPSYEVYKILRSAFRGGNTHANRYYVGAIQSNVYSFDRSSSYPDVQVNAMFPVTPFCKMEASTRVLERCRSHAKAIIMTAYFRNISLRDKYWGSPYIPLDKCIKIGNYVNDNGRILEADFLKIALTDIDFSIIECEYRWDYLEISDLYSSAYGRLPQPLLDVTISYFKTKTSLKGMEGQEVFYTKAKNQLNSVYGMCAENPVKQRVYVKKLEYVEGNEDPEKILLSTRNRQFLPYQWGVWVTAQARYRLEEGIRLAGDDFLYCDTDCVKSLTEIDFSKYNSQRITDSKKTGAFAVDAKGVTHYMGVFETEEKADRFITWGAKKYAYEVDGRIQSVVSGVNRKKAPDEIRKLGGLEAFKPGMIFRDAGGQTISYRDHESRFIVIEEHEVELCSNACILPSTYELGITSDYEKLLYSLDMY